MKVTGITKSELISIITHWKVMSATWKWYPPQKVQQRRAEEKTHRREIVFFIDGVNEVYVKIGVRCTSNHYYCAKEVYYNGRRQIRNLMFLEKVLMQGSF